MLFYLIVTAIILGAGYGLYRFWHGRVAADLAEGAKVEFEMLSRTDPDLLQGMDEAAFTEIYERTHLPRFPAYLLLTIGAFLIGTPILLMVMQGMIYFGEQWGMIPQPGDVATELYLSRDGASVVRKVSPETLAYIVQGWSGFYYFFGLLGFWMAVVWVMMSRYHRRSPGSLREEVLRAR